ncbi:MAG: ABC transporter transmembrane domain-containing protein, partial [Eubacteriales bacterium]|nr:ABC transporter transmembrane domain-containing protein [Eubacteriales bacterium]
MNLNYRLPENAEIAARGIINENEILYCVPFDLDEKGGFTDGWLVITFEKALFIDDGKIVVTMDIKEGSEYKHTGLVGNGILEAEYKGHVRPLVRYSMKHVARYVFVARILNSLAKGEKPKVVSVEDENVCPVCGRNYLRGTRICPRCSRKTAVIKRLFAITKPYWYMFVTVIVSFWLNAGLHLISPRLYRALTDDVLVPMKKDLRLILLIVGGIAGCSVLTTVIAIIRGRIMAVAGGRLSMDLKGMVYTKIQSLSLSYIDQKETGELMNRVTGDTRRIQNFLQDSGVMFINESVLLVGVFVILF